MTGRDGGDFRINEDGELTFKDVPDHENPADSNKDNEYAVTVRGRTGGTTGSHGEVNDGDKEEDRISYRENEVTLYKGDGPGEGRGWSVRGTDKTSGERGAGGDGLRAG